MHLQGRKTPRWRRSVPAWLVLALAAGAIIAAVPACEFLGIEAGTPAGGESDGGDTGDTGGTDPGGDDCDTPVTLIEQTVWSGGWNMPGGVEARAQTVTLDSDVRLHSIEFMLNEDSETPGDPTVTLSVREYSGSGDADAGGVVASSSRNGIIKSVYSPQFEAFDFPDHPALDAGQYALVLVQAEGELWQWSTSSNPYAGGHAHRKIGGNWYTSSGSDLAMRVNVCD